MNQAPLPKPPKGGRRAALNSHAKALASGNPFLHQAAIQHLTAMNPTDKEVNYVQKRAQRLSVAKNPHILPATRSGIGGPGVRGGGGLIKGIENIGKAGIKAGLNLDKTIYRAGAIPGEVRPYHESGSQQLQAQKNLVNDLTGYRQIEKIRQHPISGGVALAGILPIGRLAKGLELGVDAARGVNTTEHAVKLAQAAEDAKGLRKLALQRRAIRVARRTNSPEEAHAILQAEAQKATARALKKARKNPAFLEHLPGEARPETGGQIGLAVRQAMKGVKKTYKQQKELQAVESAKRLAAMAHGQEAAGSLRDLAAQQKHLAGNLPTVPFKGFESLRPIEQQIKAHLDTLNILPHDRNRLANAITRGIEGKVPIPSERKLIESVFGKEVNHLSPEAIQQRGIERTIADVLNFPRALESSADLSGALRQNLAAALTNPKLAFGGYHETLHAALSESKYNELMNRDIYSNPYYHMAIHDGLPITEIGGHHNLNQMEEAYASNIAEHMHELPGVRNVPGVRTVAKGASAVVRGSDRNYVLLLNRTRMRFYQAYIEQAAENGWRLDGPQGEKLRKQIADTVATITGRGNLGKRLSAHRATFNALFFSPGLMKSRINLLNPYWYVHAEPFARQQRLKTALRMYGVLAATLASAKYGLGLKVSTDPTNANFGKIQWGNTRIDIAGGETQYMRLIGQLYEGKITSSITGKVEPLSNGPFHTSRGNVLQQFARSKASPVAGLVYDALFGPGFGQKQTPGSVAQNMFLPLLIQDMQQIATAHGPGGGPGAAAATFLPDLLGIGIQNYGPKKKKGRAGSSNSNDPYGGGSSGGGSDPYGGGGSSSGSDPYGG